MHDLSKLDRRVAATARAAQIALWALVALCIAWEAWWAPTGHRTLVLKVVPLLCAAPGLWRQRLYTHRWLSLLVWVYAAEGAVRAASDQGVSRGLAAAEVVLACVLFAACGLFVRATLARNKLHGLSAGLEGVATP